LAAPPAVEGLPTRPPPGTIPDELHQAGHFRVVERMTSIRLDEYPSDIIRSAVRISADGLLQRLAGGTLTASAVSYGGSVMKRFGAVMMVTAVPHLLPVALPLDNARREARDSFEHAIG
jgi:hypothetical protein